MKMSQHQADEQSLGALKARILFAVACLALVGLGVAGAWFISANPFSPSRSVDGLLHFLLSHWMILTYVVIGTFVLFGWWFLRFMVRVSPRTADFDTKLRRDGKLLALVLVAFTLALSGIGYLFVDDFRSSFKKVSLTRQASIARLKADQVAKWILEQSADAQSLALSMQSLPLDRLSEAPEARQIVSVLFAQALAGNDDRTAITLLAPDGSVLVSAGEDPEPDEFILKSVAGMHRQVTRLHIVDAHVRSGSKQNLEMSFVLPIGSGGGTDAVVAVVVVKVDPSRRLFKEIGVWPTESLSSEAILIRREGDDIVALTSLRFRDAPAADPLFHHMPLARLELPAAQAVLNGDGVHEGVDYRGIKVLAASHSVVGVPWWVIAKTDFTEVMLPIQQKTYLVGSVIAAVILVATFMIAILWHGQRASYLAFRDGQLTQRAAMSRHLEQVVRLARDIVFLVDADGLVVEANEAAAKAYGYSVEEFQRFNVRDLRAAQARPDFEADWNAGAKPGGILFETIHKRRDGTTFPVEISTRAFDIDGKSFRQTFIRDISVRKNLEFELKRLERLQTTLYEATTILLRAQTEEELFQGMCNAIVAQGGYLVASVALANHDVGRTVRFATVAGPDSGYLARAHISWGEGPYSMGPTGAAIKTGQIQVDQDFATNPAVAPWRDEALRRGAHAAIGLPLRAWGEIFGALTIYSTKANDFNAEEVALLTRFADDISYGVSSLRAHVAANAGLAVN